MIIINIIVIQYQYINFWEFPPLFFLPIWSLSLWPLPPPKKARLITRAQVRSRWEICGITTVESLKTNCKCEWVLLLLLLKFVSGEMCWQLLRLFMCLKCNKSMKVVRSCSAFTAICFSLFLYFVLCRWFPTSCANLQLTMRLNLLWFIQK